MKTGIDIMDEQHEKLVNIINRLYKIYHTDNPKK